MMLKDRFGRLSARKDQQQRMQLTTNKESSSLTRQSKQYFTPTKLETVCCYQCAFFPLRACQFILKCAWLDANVLVLKLSMTTYLAGQIINYTTV